MTQLDECYSDSLLLPHLGIELLEPYGNESSVHQIPSVHQAMLPIVGVPVSPLLRLGLVRRNTSSMQDRICNRTGSGIRT